MRLLAAWVERNGMSDPLIVFDVSNLAYRAFHVLKDLSHDGVLTGVTFGILRDIIDIGTLFNTRRFAFAFDEGKPKRKAIYPEYKAQRARKADEDPEVRKARALVREQINEFHYSVLPALGYNNAFAECGYEADDIIAGIRDATSDDVIIVGTDQDLYQLIDSKTLIWNPVSKKAITKKAFEEKYHITPTMWSSVKALTGCKSDNIAGIPGVGEKTAVKYLTGSLTKGRAFDAIIEHTAMWNENEKLTRLPYPGMSSISLHDDEVTPRRWSAVLSALGIHVLRYA